MARCAATSAGPAAVALAIVPGAFVLIAPLFGHHYTKQEYMFTAFLTFFPLMLIAEPVLAYSTVVTRPFPEEAKAREERNSKVRFALLGAAPTCVVTLLGMYIKYQFWP